MLGPRSSYQPNRRALLRSLTLAAGGLASLPLLTACSHLPKLPGIAPTPAVAPPTVPATSAISPTPAIAVGATTKGVANHPPVWQQAAGKPIRGGILSSALASDVGNLLVMHSPNEALRVAANFCYRRLVQFRASQMNDLTIVPDMADSWEVLDGGKTYVFHLHPGITWHNLPPVNGREFTSADVDWTIQYYKTKDPEYGWLWSWVTKWETPDRYTVVLHADQPNAEALQSLAVDNNVLLAKEVYDQDGSYQNHIVGTGPFIWQSWQPGVKVEVRRNPSYWEMSELDGKRLPYLDGIDLLVMPDYPTRLAAFHAQQIDGGIGGFVPNRADVASLQRDLAHLRSWTGAPMVSGDGLIVNTATSPWNDVRVRQACSLALDRDALLKDVFGNSSWGTWAGFLSYAFGQDAWLAENVHNLVNLKYDPTTARAMIADAGAGAASLPITTYSTSGPGLTLVQTVKQMWQAVGLNAQIDQVDIPTAFQRRVTGDFSVLGDGAEIASPSLDAATRQFYHTGGARNYGRVSDAVLDDLTDRQLVELDPAKRAVIFGQIQQRLYDQMWKIPHVLPTNVVLEQAWVMNKAWTWQPAWAYPERVWLDRSHPSA